ncbi:MAG: phage tail tape measure protein [Actinomycetota bacterium]
MANATEAGVAYTRILPSMDGFSSKVSQALKSGLSGPATKAGDAAGGKLGKGIVSGVDGASGKLKSAAGRVGDIFKVGLATAGLAGAAALTAGISGALDTEVATDKLEAQLGGGEWAAGMGEVAANLYGQAFGDSIGETAEAVRQVFQAGLFEDDVGAAEIEELTATALTFSDVMDQDLTSSIRAVKNMIASGLADDATHAFDILTAGAQQTGDLAGDLSETFTEYSTQFREIGLSGEDAMGLLAQGANAGARDLDVVADSLKELAIRAKDGSDASMDAFRSLGLNADDMRARFVAGGEGAREGLDMILDGLRDLDANTREDVLVDLFGTKSEDLQGAFAALDLDSAAAMFGDVTGKTEELGSAYDNAATRIEAFKRQGLQRLTEFVGNHVIPGLERLAEFIGPILSRAFDGLQGLLDKIDFRQITDAFITFKAGFDTGETFGGGALSDFAATVGIVAAEIVGFVQDVLVPGIQSGAELLGQFWAEQGPVITDAIGQIVAIVGDGIALVVAAIERGVDIATFIWDNWGAEITAVAETAWALISGIVQGGLDVIQGIIRTVTAVLEGDWSAAWDGIKQVVDGVWTLIETVVQNGIDTVKNIAELGLAALKTGFSAAWDGIKMGLAAGWDAITARFRRGFDTIKLRAKVGWALIKGTFTRVLTEIKTFVRDRLDDVIGFFRRFPGRVRSGFSSLARTITAPFRSAFNSIKSLWNRTVGGFSVDIPGFMGFGGVSFSIPSMHDGGMVPGPAGSEHLRLLEAGEGVFTRDQMQAIGSIQAAPAPAPAVVHLHADGLDDGLRQWFRHAVRVEGGGNVQLAFGQAA